MYLSYKSLLNPVILIVKKKVILKKSLNKNLKMQNFLSKNVPNKK